MNKFEYQLLILLFYVIPLQHGKKQQENNEDFNYSRCVDNGGYDCYFGL